MATDEPQDEVAGESNILPENQDPTPPTPTDTRSSYRGAAGQQPRSIASQSQNEANVDSWSGATGDLSVAVAVAAAAFPSSAQLVGHDPASHYDFGPLLGQGGMGAVYRARDRVLGREVAIKLMLQGDQESRQRLFHEARAMARLDHPHICKIYEIGEIAGRDYIAMQLVDGISLKDMFPQLSLVERVSVVRTVALAIHEAHRLGFIHRDIKPANIMIERTKDGRLHPMVMDFGLARELAHGSTITATNVMIGSPPYMAPEQVRANQDLDRRTDVYSLGATLYELVVEQPPFDPHLPVMTLIHAMAIEEPPPPRSIKPALAVDLETVLLKCLAKDPDRRYDSAWALAEDLGRVLDGEPIQGRRPGLLYRAQRLVRRYRSLAIAFGIALVWSLGLLIYGLHSVVQARRQSMLAAELAERIKSIEWALRAVHEMPRHGTETERRAVRAQMNRIAQQTRGPGSWSYGLVEYALGRGELALGKIDAALSHLQKAVQAGLDTPELHYALGMSLSARYERALAEVRYGGDPAWRERRRRELGRRYLDPALVSLEKSHDLQLESSQLLAAQVAFDRQRYDEATATAREALAETPWAYEGLLLIARAHLLHGWTALDRGLYDAAYDEFAMALTHARRAADIGRSDATVYEGIADALLGQAEADWRQHQPQTVLDEVLAVCDQALAVEATRVDCYLKKSRALWLRVNDVSARDKIPAATLKTWLASAERAVELAPDHAPAHDALGNVLAESGFDVWIRGGDPRPEWTRAQAELEKAITLQPDYPWAFNDLGILHRRWGEYQKWHSQDPRPRYARAIESYRRALRVDPDYLYACSNLVDLYAELVEDAVHRGLSPRAEVEAAALAGQRCRAIDRKFSTVVINQVRVELLYAEHLIDADTDPGAVLEQVGAQLDELHALAPQDVRRSLFAALWYQLKARDRLRQGQDPQPLLRLGEHALVEAAQQAPICVDCEIVRARLLRAAAAWAERRRLSATPTLDAARRVVQRALTFVPENVDTMEELAGVGAALAVSQRSRATQNVIQDSLGLIQRVLARQPWRPRAHAIRAQLLRLQAQRLSEPTTRRETVRAARRELEQALADNPSLVSEYSLERTLLDRLVAPPRE